MKKSLIFLITILFCSALYAQNINFSGTWKLNSSKSNLNYDFTLAPATIIVIHKGNEISIEKHSNMQGQEYKTTDKYTCDGKECINMAWENMEKKSTAVWSDDKKSLKVTSKLAAGGDIGDVSIVEIYRMDNGNMILDSVASSSYGDLNEKMVYDKQQ